MGACVWGAVQAGPRRAAEAGADDLVNSLVGANTELERRVAAAEAATATARRDAAAALREAQAESARAIDRANAATATERANAATLRGEVTAARERIGAAEAERAASAVRTRNLEARRLWPAGIFHLACALTG